MPAAVPNDEYALRVNSIYLMLKAPTKDVLEVFNCYVNLISNLCPSSHLQPRRPQTSSSRATTRPHHSGTCATPASQHNWANPSLVRQITPTAPRSARTVASSLSAAPTKPLTSGTSPTQPSREHLAHRSPDRTATSSPWLSAVTAISLRPAVLTRQSAYGTSVTLNNPHLSEDPSPAPTTMLTQSPLAMTTSR